MKRELSRSIVAVGLALVCIVGPGMAQAANIVASETGDTATLAGSQFDITPFTSRSNGELADGSGAFIANSPATGSALVVLTERPGGPNSDWLELVYSNDGAAPIGNGPLALGFRPGWSPGITDRRYPRVPRGDGREPGRHRTIGRLSDGLWLCLSQQHHGPGSVGCAGGGAGACGVSCS